MGQDIFTGDLVVQSMKLVAGFCLRFRVPRGDAGQDTRTSRYMLAECRQSRQPVAMMHNYENKQGS
jgi:hypothetical protein